MEVTPSITLRPETVPEIPFRKLQHGWILARPETREVSTQTDERPQAREVSIQTEERRWHGVHMERARTVPEQPGYKRLLRSLRGEADALPPLKEADVLHEHEKPWT